MEGCISLLFTRNSSTLYTCTSFPETSTHTNKDYLSATSKRTQVPTHSPPGLSRASTAPDTCTVTVYAYPQLLPPLQPLNKLKSLFGKTDTILYKPFLKTDTHFPGSLMLSMPPKLSSVYNLLQHLEVDTCDITQNMQQWQLQLKSILQQPLTVTRLQL